MQSIKKRYIGPRINWTELCDICGVPWHATDLTARSDGSVVCQGCIGGMTETEIAMYKASVILSQSMPIVPSVRRRRMV